MLVQRARPVYWKKWAAKHEYEELKEGAWLEPGLALVRKKEKEIGLKSIEWLGRSFWKEVGRKKRLFDIEWSDNSQCQACQREEGTEKHRLYNCPEWHAVVRGIPEAFRKWEQRRKHQRKNGNGKQEKSEKHRS